MEDKIVGRTMNGKDANESEDVIVEVGVENDEISFSCSDETYLVVNEKQLRAIIDRK